MAYLVGWSKFIEGTIADADMPSALSGFPIAVKISTASGLSNQDVSAVFDEIGSNWKKVTFQLGESETESYAEMEMWDAVNEVGLFHVKFDLSSGENKFRMYYDSTHADNDPYVGAVGSTPAQSVWNSDYAARYGFAQDPTGGTIYDSTGNANNGTPSGGMTSADLVDAGIGKGLDFDGADDCILVGDTASLSGLTAITFELQFFPRLLSGDRDVFAKWSPGNQEWLFRTSGSSYFSAIYGQLNSAGSATTDTLQTMTVLWDGGGAPKIYKDGNYVADFPFTPGTPADTGSPVYIARFSGSAANFFNGILTELRMSSVARSEAWIAATHKCLNDELITYTGEQFPTTYEIYGIAQAGGTASPGSKILLIDRVTLELVATATATDVTAEYAFTGLPSGDAGRYAIHMIDPTNTYNDVAVSAITAELEA